MGDIGMKDLQNFRERMAEIFKLIEEWRLWKI